MKQCDLAERLGVSQSTISRVESGELRPEGLLREHILEFVSARLQSANDTALARLVQSAATPVHLVCDISHRLLAASKPREAMWGIAASDLTGHSLWRFASEAIQNAESQLDALGWGERGGVTSLRFVTGQNTSSELKIWPQALLWERITLSDGSPARLDWNIRTPE